MENHFVTKSRVASGTFFSFWEKIYTGKDIYKEEKNVLKKFRFVKYFKVQANLSVDRVALYKDIQGEKVVVKKLAFRYKNLAYHHMYHEASIFQKLKEYTYRDKKISKYTIAFPKVIYISERKQTLYVVTEYIPGKKLEEFSKKIKKEVLLLSIDAYSKMPQIKQIPRLSHRAMIFSFPLYLIISILRWPEGRTQLIKLLWYFYRDSIFFPTKYITYVLSHRDLHTDNIILSGRKAVILDTEVSKITEKGTDLAIAARLFFGELGESEIRKILHTYLKTDYDYKQFIYLTIFYTIQVLTFEHKKNKQFDDAKTYTMFLINSFIPDRN